MVPLEGLSLSGVIMVSLVSLLIIFSLISLIVYLLYKMQTIHIKFEPIKITELITVLFTIGSFVTVIITITSLIFQSRVLLIQTDCNIKSSQGHALGFITNNSLSVDKLFIDNPQLRPYFYNNKPITKNDKFYDTVSATAEYLLDYYDSLLVHLNLSPYIEIHYRKTWEASIIDSFLWSPILCSHLEENRPWFNDELFALYEKAQKIKKSQE